FSSIPSCRICACFSSPLVTRTTSIRRSASAPSSSPRAGWRFTIRTPMNEPSDPPKTNLFRPHHWHGLEVGPDPPEVLNAYIEITPFDLMKYEVDKVSGYLRVDRPQRSSAQHPTLYGFVPRTYCGERVRRLAPAAKRGVGDPLDICVLSERAIARNEI